MKKDKLHNIKAIGFKTPEHYFESFEDKFFERLNEKETIEGIETSGYKVPKNYFETFDHNLIKTLNPKENTSVIRLQPRKTFYYVAGIAASFVLLLSLFLNNNDTISIDGIDTASIENYLYQEDYTNDDLASLFKSDDISETDFIDITISNETLNQYLENIDTEDLILD